jgi:Protein of unknown function (DUF2637)
MNTAATMSQRQDNVIRRLSVAAVFLVTISAAVLSFTNLATVAERNGTPHVLAPAFVLSIDGMILASSLSILHASLRTGDRALLSRLGLVLGSGLSVWGNVSAGSDSGAESWIVHATPPAALILSLEIVMAIFRKRFSAQLVAAEKAERMRLEDVRRNEAAAAASARAASERQVQAVLAHAKTGSKPLRGGEASPKQVEALRAAAKAVKGWSNLSSKEQLTFLRVQVREDLSAATIIASGVMSRGAGEPQARHHQRIYKTMSECRKAEAAMKSTAPRLVAVGG